MSAPQRLRRLEPAALGGVMSRDWLVFRSYWRSTTFSATVEPTLYLLMFGAGFGSLVGTVAGYEYVEFLGTGVVATGALFSSVFPGMFNTWVRMTYQRTYDALLAAPVDVEELVTAETGWIACRAGTYCMAPLIVAIFFGLDPSPGMLLVPIIGWLTGFAWANTGVVVAATANSMDNFNYFMSSVVTPMFLVAGTFFPLDELPAWAETAGQVNPLHHTVELVRHAVFGFEGWVDVAHLAVLVGFAAVMWRVSVRLLTRRLID